VSTGEVIGEAWALYRAHFVHLVAIAFVVYALIAVFTLVLILLLGNFGAFIAVFLSIAGVLWLQGALVIAVEDVRDGRADLSVRQTLGRVRPRLNTLSLSALVVLVAFFLAAIVILVGLAIFILPGLVLVGFFIWRAVRWSLLIPVVMLESRGVFGALDRSSELVRSHWWQCFGVILVTLFVLIGAGIAIDIALSPLPDSLQGLVGQLVSAMLAAPFAALAWTLMYFRLRGAGQPVAAQAA
jgi:hypothetical protein